jgi:hypothetical protein
MIDLIRCVAPTEPKRSQTPRTHRHSIALQLNIHDRLRASWDCDNVARPCKTMLDSTTARRRYGLVDAAASGPDVVNYRTLPSWSCTWSAMNISMCACGTAGSGMSIGVEDSPLPELRSMR